MDWLILALGGAAAAILFFFKDATAAPLSLSPTAKGPWTVEDAIRQGIVLPLSLPDECVLILRVQSQLETGNWLAKSFVNTNSLFNRHVGSGKGDWIGAGKPKSSLAVNVDFYDAGPGDRDLRKFTDIGQSARDMAQLLSDGLYVNALSALRRADAKGYYTALTIAGFAADPSYAVNLTRNYEDVA